MAITRYAGDRFVGLSEEKDSLLTKVIDGALYLAVDQNKQYVKKDGSWVRFGGSIDGSGISGYVARWSDEDSLTSGLIFDDGVSGVGINTTSPQHALHVSGDAQISGYLYDSQNSTGEAGYILASEEGGPQWKQIEDVLSGVGGSGAANYVARWADEDTLTTGVLVDNGTNVGINVPSPNFPLEISSSGNATIRIEDTTNASRLDLRAEDSAVLIRSTSNFPMRFDVNQTERMRIDTAGKVGIGTTTPAYGLDIRNSTTSQTGALYIQAALNSSGKGLVINSNTRTVADNAEHLLQIIDRSNSNSLVTTVEGVTLVRLGTRLNTLSPLQVNSQIALGGSIYTFSTVQGGADLTLTSNANPANIGVLSNIKFKLGSSGGGGPNERMRIQSDGSIGVFNTTDIENWAGSAYRAIEFPRASLMYHTGTSTDLYINSNAYYDGAWKYKSTAAASQFVLGSSGDALIRTIASGTIDTGITWTTPFIVKNTGNVGIGTNDPDAKLDVRSASGSVGLTVGNTTGDTRLQITSTENSDVTFNVGDASGMGTSRSFIFETGNSERMRIAVDGNVGIGIDPAGAKLQVAGGIRISDGSKVYLYTSNDLNYLTYNRWQVHTSTALAIDNTSTGGFQVQDSGTTVLFVGTDSTYGGRVGIGTVTPSAKLHVHSTTGILHTGDDYDSWVLKYLSNQGSGSAVVNYYLIAAKTQTNVRFDGVLKGARQVGTSATGSGGARITFYTNNDGTPLATGGLESWGTDVPTYEHPIFKLVELTYNSVEYYAIEISPSTSWAAAFTHVQFEGYANNVLFTNLGTASVSGVAEFSGEESVFSYKYGNLGIGTGSPDAKLHIADSGGDVKLIIDRTDARTYSIYTESNGSLRIKDEDAGTDRISIKSDGNVGIGNDDPQVKLHITGSGSAGSVDNVLVLQSDVSNAPAIQFSESTGAGFNNGMNIAYRGDFGGGSDNAIVIAGISTSSSSVGDAVATFKNGGNVGIGTTAPGYKLDVVTPASGAIHVRSTAQTHGLLMGSAAYSSGDSYVGLKTTVMTGSSDYMIISGGTSDKNTYISAADTYSVKIRGGGNNTTNEIIVTDSGNNTYSAGGFHYFQSGNIGIGVAPTQKLHVQGNLRVTGAYYDSNNEAGTSNQVLTSTGSGGTDWKSLSQISDTVTGSGTTNKITKWSDGPNSDLTDSSFLSESGATLTNTATATEFTTTNTQLRLPNYGRVAIGAASTNSVLLADVGDNATFNNGEAVIKGENSGNRGAVGHASGSDLLRLNFSNALGMILNKDGHVGIGTDPKAKLEVDLNQTNGTLAADNYAHFGGPHHTNGSVMGITLGYREANLLYRKVGIVARGLGDTHARQDLDFLVSTAAGSASVTPSDAKLTISGLTGNVGIGTTSPTGGKLQVAGKVRIDAGSGNDALNLNAYDLLKWDNSSHIHFGGYKTGQWTVLKFYSSSTERLNISGDVNVQGATDLNINGPSRRFSFTSGTGTIRTTTSNNLILQTNSISAITIYPTRQVQFNAYGSGTFTGTATQRLAVDSSGNVIEIPIGSGPVDGSGAANKVTYWTDTDTISYNNNFHWDNTNGNLGVGTAAPSSTLHVSDSTSGTSVLKVDGTSGTIFEVTDDLSSSLMSVNTIAGLPVFEVFADNHIVAGRYNQNDFYLNTNGNLGLGTSSPITKLNIKGDQSANGQLYIEPTNDSEYAGLVIKTTRGADRAYAIFAGGTGTDDLNFRFRDASAGADRMVIDSSGNVGIGTTSPTYEVHVLNSNSRIVADDGTAQTKLQASGGIGYVGTLTNHDLRLTTNNTERVTIDASGNVGIGTDDPETKLHVYSSSSTETFTNLSGIGVENSGSSNSYYVFQTATGGGGKSFSITNAGNIGIGTTDPNYKLDVNAGLSSGSGIGYPVRVGHGSMATNGDGVGVLFSRGSSEQYFGYVRIQSTQSNPDFLNPRLEFGIQDTGTYNLADASTRMVIDGDGNVGINTLTPQGKLDINTETAEPTHVYINGEVNQNKLLYFRHYANSEASANNVALGYIGSNGIDNLLSLGHLNSSGTDVPIMHLTEAGNVGIGTTDPQAQLHIYGGDLDTRAYQQNNSTNSIYLNPINGNANGTSNTGGGGVIWKTWYNNYTKKSAGILAIGEGNYFRSGLAFYTNNNANQTTDWSERMRIDMDGNVGISTTNPLFKLHVNGDIYQDVGYSIYSNANRGWYRGNYTTTGSGVSNGKIVTLNPSHGQAASSNYHYIFELTTIGTSTNSGATYIGVYSADASAWSLRAVSLSGSSSNHPQLSVSGNNFTVYTDHSSNYTVVVSVTTVYNGDADSTAHSLGANYQWQRAVNDLYYNDGLVGIGTGTPSQKLHVQGNLRLTGAFYDSNNATGTSGQVLTSTGSATDWKDLDEISGVTASNPTTTNYVTKWFDGANEEITDSIIYDNGTNVGISTATPSAKLQVAGNTYLNSGSNVWNLIGNNGIDFARETYFGYSSSYRILQLGTVRMLPQTRAISIGVDVSSNASGSFGGDEIIFPNQREIITPNAANNGYLGLIATDNQNKVRIGNYRWNILNDTPGITIDTSASTNYVGIGTTSPDSKLHIYEAATAPSLLTLHNYTSDILNDGSTGNFIDFKSTDNNTNFTPQARIGMVVQDPAGDGGISSEGHGNFVVYTSEGTDSSGNGVLSEKLRVSPEGNVGIGNTNPTRKLSVHNSAAGSIANFLHYTDASNYQGLYIEVSQTTDIVNLKSSGSSSGGFAFFAGANEKVRIDSSGNVGIGTISPSAGFHVVNATEPTVLFESTNAGSSGSRLQLYHNSASPADNDILSNIQMAGEDSSGAKRYAALIQTIAADVNASSVDGDIRFLTYKSNTASEVMRITHDANVSINGGSVVEGSNSHADIQIGEDGGITMGATYTFANIYGDGGNLHLRANSYPANTGSTSIIYLQTSSASGGQAPDVVVKGGNVGIGTAVPSQALTVATAMGTAGQWSSSQIRLETTNTVDTTGWQGISFDTSTTDNYGWSIGVNRSGSGRGSFRVYEHVNSATGTERFTIEQDGNVGIGTTNPDSLLHIDTGANSAANFRLGANRTAADVAVGQVAGDWDGTIVSKIAFKTGDDTTNKDNGEIAFEVAAAGTTAEAMRIDKDGKVGIGTTNPSSKLTVAEGTDQHGVEIQPGTLSYIQAYDRATSDYGDLSIDAQTLRFATDNGAERVRIDSSGNVGIGTTAPTKKLDVNGDVKIAGDTLNAGFLQAYGSNYSVGNNNYGVFLGTYSGGTSGTSISPGEVILSTQGKSGWAVGDGLGRIRFFLGDSSGIGVRDVAKIEALSEDGNGTTASAGLAFHTSPYNSQVVERVRIASDGNVGIGTTDPTSLLHVKGSTGSTFISVQDFRSNTDDVAGVRFSTSANATVNFKSFISHIETGTNGQGDLIFAVNNSNTAVDATVSDERMRIKQSGKIRLNEYGEGDFTSGTVTYRLAVDASGDVMEIPIGDGPVDGSGTDDYIARWTDPNTLGIGKIRDDNSTVAINTAPDSSYMLKVAGNGYFSGTLTEASSLAIKENIENFTPSIDKINKIRPVKYNKKGSDKKEIGLIAEELEELFPELVEKDENGNPSGVNYSRAVTVLLGGFKELYKELQEIKKRI